MKATRAVVLRRAASPLLLPFAPTPPAWADGLDAALKPCPDTRIVCFSSFDPTHFMEQAWEDTKGEQAATVDAVSAELARLGGAVDKPERGQRGTALYAKFVDPDTGKSDRTVMWFPSDDNIIHFRSERIDEPVWDGNANKNRLLSIKKNLKLELSATELERELGAADMARVGRNEAGQIVAEREALQ